MSVSEIPVNSDSYRFAELMVLNPKALILEKCALAKQSTIGLFQ